MISRAAVVLHAGAHDWKASAEGTGAVDALFRAVNAALRDVLGGSPLLLAYDVHALAEGPDAEGRVTVRIAPPSRQPGERSGRPLHRRGRLLEHRRGVAWRRTSRRSTRCSEARRGPAWPTRPGRPGVAPRSADHAGSDAEFDAHAEPHDTNEWFNR